MVEPATALAWVVQQDWWKAVTSIVATASVLAAIIPGKSDDVIIKWAKFGVDILAFNWGNAENKKK